MSSKKPSAPDFSATNDKVLSAALKDQPQISALNNASASDTARAMADANASYNPISDAINKALGKQIQDYSVDKNDYTDQSSALRSALESQLTNNVNLNGQLNDQQLYNLGQASRQAQLARGNTGGNAASFQETLNSLNYGNDLARSNRAEAQSFLGSGQSTNDIHQRLLAAYNGAVQQGVTNAGNYVSQNNQMTAPLTSALAQGNTVNVNSMLNNATSAYGTDGSIYKTQMDNYVSPWAMAGKVAGTIGMAALTGGAGAGMGLGAGGATAGLSGGAGANAFFNGGGFENQLASLPTSAGF